jgi:hypothetical protein
MLRRAADLILEAHALVLHGVFSVMRGWALELSVGAFAAAEGQPR